MSELIHDLRQIKHTIARRCEQHLSLPVAGCAAGSIGDDQQCCGSTIGEYARAWWQPPPGIQHNPDGTRARNKSRRQLRIIGGDGSGADDNGLVQRAQPVQMPNILLIVDEFRVPARRCDIAIDTLPEVSEDLRPGCVGLALRQVQIDEGSRCSDPRPADGLRSAPGLACREIEQPLPGQGFGQGLACCIV